MFFRVVLLAGCLNCAEYLAIHHVSDTPPAKGEIVPFTSEDLLRYPALEGMQYRVSISENPLLHGMYSRINPSDLPKYAGPYKR